MPHKRENYVTSVNMDDVQYLMSCVNESRFDNEIKRQLREILDSMQMHLISASWLYIYDKRIELAD